MVTEVPAQEIPNLPGVELRHLELGEHRERTLVTVAPGGVIPLHTHSVDAEMIITSGSGKVLSDDEFNGRPVSVGYRVFFKKDRAHGFQAGPMGLAFMSFNGGIRRPDGSLDLVMA